MEDNVCVKRSDLGITARDWDSVIGRKAVRDFHIDDGIVIQAENMSKNRDLRLDLVRVLAIVGVVTLHVAGGGVR